MTQVTRREMMMSCVCDAAQSLHVCVLLLEVAAVDCMDSEC